MMALQMTNQDVFSWGWYASKLQPGVRFLWHVVYQRPIDYCIDHINFEATELLTVVASKKYGPELHVEVQDGRTLRVMHNAGVTLVVMA